LNSVYDVLYQSINAKYLAWLHNNNPWTVDILAMQPVFLINVAKHYMHLMHNLLQFFIVEASGLINSHGVVNVLISDVIPLCNSLALNSGLVNTTPRQHTLIWSIHKLIAIYACDGYIFRGQVVRPCKSNKFNTH
jgi:hypothetical protein